jgi:hypothetical protein
VQGPPGGGQVGSVVSSRETPPPPGPRMSGKLAGCDRVGIAKSADSRGEEGFGVITSEPLVSIHGDVSDELGRRTATRGRPVFAVSALGDVAPPAGAAST